MGMNQFISKWNGRCIEDAGSYQSEEFKLFARELRNALKSEAKKKSMSLASFTVGHYFVSGFFEKDQKFVYFQFDVRRYERPIDLFAGDYMNGFLYRSAKNEKDYTGGQNHFCSCAELMNQVDHLIA